MFNFVAYFKNKHKHVKRDFEHDEEGNPFVEVGVRDKSEVIAPFSVDGKLSINMELASTLDNLGKSLSPKDRLHFNIKCENWSDQEKFDLASAIKYYFSNCMIETQRKLESNFKIFLTMVALSIFFVLLLFLADFIAAPFIVIEVIDIITWGFVWEAVDLIAFQRKLYLFEYNRDKVIYNMKITFDK